MANLDAWEWALLAVAGYMAIMSLVRLMGRHRDEVLDRLRRRIENEGKRRKQQQLEARLEKQDAPTVDGRRKTDAA